MVSLARAIFLSMSGTLLISAIPLLYTVYAYAHNVMYARGVRLHATALLLLTVGWLFSDALSFGLIPVEGLELLPDVLYVLAAAVFLGAVWEFARDVVDFEGSDEDAFDAAVPAGSDSDPDWSETGTGGFESARD